MIYINGLCKLISLVFYGLSQARKIFAMTSRSVQKVKGSPSACWLHMPSPHGWASTLASLKHLQLNQSLNCRIRNWGPGKDVTLSKNQYMFRIHHLLGWKSSDKSFYVDTITISKLKLSWSRGPSGWDTNMWEVIFSISIDQSRVRQLRQSPV